MAVQILPVVPACSLECLENFVLASLMALFTFLLLIKAVSAQGSSLPVAYILLVSRNCDGEILHHAQYFAHTRGQIVCKDLLCRDNLKKQG